MPEFYDTDITIARIDQLAELSLEYGITTTFSPLFVNGQDTTGVDRTMKRVEEQFRRGARVWPQVQTRPIDISFSFEVPSLLFIRLRGWYGLLRFSSHPEILAAFKDVTKRAELVAEAAPMERLWNSLILRQVQSEANKQYLGMTLAEIGEKRGDTALDVMIDLSIEEELGAHILSFATFGDTGYLFSEFVREAGLLRMEEAVRKITHDTAKIWGMENRGLIQNGYQADITIFDPDTIARGAEYFVQDVPGDGNRYVRDAIGIDCVVINGAIAYEHASGYTDSHRGQIISGQNGLNR